MALDLMARAEDVLRDDSFRNGELLAIIIKGCELASPADFSAAIRAFLDTNQAFLDTNRGASTSCLSCWGVNDPSPLPLTPCHSK